MGKLVKFGEYFYKEDPSTKLENIVDGFLRTGYLSKKNISDLSDIGLSKDDFINIYNSYEFCINVKSLLYDVEKWDIFNTLLLDLDLYNDGSFKLSHSDVNFKIVSNGGAHKYNYELFDVIKLSSLDFKNILLEILNRKNSDDISKVKRYYSKMGTSSVRKAKWFKVDTFLDLSLTFTVQSIYKSTSTFGYDPLYKIKKRICNVLENDVMFRFLKMNGFDNFLIKSKSDFSTSDYYTFEISVKRNEKSAEQSADFFIK